MFYNVHKDFMQAGHIYGHEEFYGMTEKEAKAKYHKMLDTAYTYNDPWTHVYITREDGVMTAGEVVDQRSPAQEE
jgi:hypothetical protein